MALILSHIAFFTMILSSSTAAENVANLVVTNSNWDQMLEGEWMIKFYAPWCPACRAMEVTWNEFADWANQYKQVQVGSVDVTNQPALNGRFMITSLPTIYHVLNGEFRQYSSSRDLEGLKGFIDKREWSEIKPGSSWTSPTSFVMSSMSKLFSFSMTLKGLHSSLNSDYGFPTWLSMLLFGLLIIIFGILLGVVLIFATDYIWGPPAYYRDDVIHKSETSGKEISSENLVVTENDAPCEDVESKNSEEAKQVNDENSSGIRQRILKTDIDKTQTEAE